jgi:hypothetical protein
LAPDSFFSLLFRRPKSSPTVARFGFLDAATAVYASTHNSSAPHG